MALLVGIGGFFLLLAIIFFFRTISNVRRRRIVRACGSGAGSITSATVAIPALILAFSYLGYARLTDEQRVSTVEFRQVATAEFEARVMIPEYRDRFFILRGDEWQMDARLLKWKPPLTLLGLDPVYQLQRIGGRYSDIERERTEERTVHSLATDSALDIWRITRKYPLLIPGIDAYYGSATYLPMADGARFSVALSRDALIARPDNEIARQIVGSWDEASH